jgi:hypothetical protein
MALKETIGKMKMQLGDICKDLEKAAGGNKAASQRVRTTTIKFERTAKLYRKESVSAEKKGGKPKKAVVAKAKVKSGGKKAGAKRATAKLPRRR